MRLRPILIIAAVCVSLALLTWSVRRSGIIDLFSGGTASDPARIRGQTLDLAGTDARDPAKRIDLVGLRGTPVLVCRMQLRGGTWLLGALERWKKKHPEAKPVILIAFLPGDGDVPAAMLAHDPTLRGVMVDREAVDRWGFNQSLAELRLVDAAGTVRTVNLATGNDRDTTIGRLEEAWKAL